MAYNRKTKDIYILIWNNEEIDFFDTFQEAKKMRLEYQLSFKSYIAIKKKRVKK